MSTTQDCKYTALRLAGHTGAISDMMRQWAYANGGSAKDTQLATLEALRANGASSNNLQLAWREALTTLGVNPGSLSDMLKEFWCDYGGVFGEIPLNAITDPLNGSPITDPLTGNYITQP